MPYAIKKLPSGQYATVKKATGKIFKFKPLGDVRPVVDAGGVFNYARKSGMIPAQK